MLCKMDGIVLRTTDYGENHRVVTVFSLEFGKIALMARGVRKTKSRLASVCQPFTYATFHAYMSASGMGTMQQGDSIDSFRALRESLNYAAYAAYIVELFDRFCDDRVPSEGAFLLLVTLFEYLRSNIDPEILARIAESKIVQIAGIRPDLNRCADCNRELTESRVFSVRQGGPLCPPCGMRDDRAHPMAPATWRLLRTFQLMDVQRLGNIRIGVPIRRQLSVILHDYMESYGGVYLKSRAFLDKLKQLDGEA